MNEIKESIVTVEDFERICRVCLQVDEDMVDIFGIEIHNQVMEITNLKVEINDRLPKTICQKCKQQIDNFCDFLQQAKSSDLYLRSLLPENEEEGRSAEQRKTIKRLPRKRLKNWCRRTKVNKSFKEETDSDKMYLIYVPKIEDCNSKLEICIKDLNSDNDNVELTQYCKTLVKNNFSDHTYPKECYNTGESKVQILNKPVFSALEDKENKPYPVKLDIYECCECQKAFEELNDLTTHLVTHETQPQVGSSYCFTCPVCACTENNKSDFLNHLQNHKEEGFSFVKINSIGDNETLQEHEREIFIDLLSNEKENCRVFLLNLGVVLCTICHHNIESKDNILKHLRTCSVEKSENEFSLKYICPVCHSLFIDEEEKFIQHLSFHQKEDFYFIKIGDDGQPAELEPNDKIYVSVEEAIEVMKIFSETGSGKLFKIVNVNSCNNCDYVSESFNQLLEHCASIHSEKMPLDLTICCPACLASFSVSENQADFYEHLRMHKQEGMNFILVQRSNSTPKFKEEYLDIFTESSVLKSIANCATISRQVCSPELVVSGTENPSSEFTCDLCHKEFKKKKEMIAHLKSHQSKEFSRESVNYICEKCGKKCSGKRSYKKHFLQHSKGLTSVGRRATCTICNKTFSNRATLNGHLRHHLREGSGNGSQTSIGIICEKCGKSFSNNATLAKHKKLHSRDKENAVLKCEICDRDFFRQSSFDRHKSAHLNPKYFECDVCKRPMSSVASLQKHLESHGNGSNTYDCKACKLSFLTKDSLSAHQTHTGHYSDRKPLECNVCHEKFFIGRKFTEHIKTHPKYKMGECNLCGKRLATIQSLMLHMGRHFESNSILCPHCGKQFFEERNYRRHLLTHKGIKPHPCDVEGCKKSFYTLFELNRHKKYHNNTRDFICVYCSKSFHEANHLTVHVRTHTGERPYACPHCGKGFVTRTRCKHHIKLVHQGVGYDLIQSTISKKVTVFEAVEAIPL